MQHPQEQPEPARFTPEVVVKMGIVFLAVNAVAIAVCVAGAFSSESYSAFTEIENTYRCLMAAELFFVLFLWPLYCRKPGAASVPAVGALLVISAPLVLVAAYVSNVPAFMVARSQLVLLAVASAVMAAWRLIGREGGTAWRWYYPAVATVAGGLPLVQFVIQDVAGGGADWLSCASPFWAMELALRSPDTVPRLYWPATLLFFAAIAAVLSAVRARRHDA